MSLNVRDYDYDLPEELIAKYPPEERSGARMLVLDRARETLEHRMFLDLPSFLRPGDIAVLNDTRVIPARLFSEDHRFEFLLLEERGPRVWVCMVRPAKKLKPGKGVRVAGTTAEVVEVLESGERLVRFADAPDLQEHGKLPLPPYLGRAAEAADQERYQTVFAREPGAVAAPTAGLHFTPELLRQLPHTFITLHVGAGTFRPVQSEDLAEHRMHEERYSLSVASAAAVNAASRVLAVGTTSVRVLETCADAAGGVQAGSGRTDLFIYPPFQFRATDCLLTNFHLPRSTLLMLVSAFAGRERVLEAYQEAVRERYRFYSYGDCMLIV